MVTKRGCRIKGNRFENDVAKALASVFGSTERVLLSGIRGEGDVAGAPCHIECKRQETLQISKWFKEEQPKAMGKPFMLVYRKSHEPARIVMDLDDFIKISLDMIAGNGYNA